MKRIACITRAKTNDIEGGNLTEMQSYICKGNNTYSQQRLPSRVIMRTKESISHTTKIIVIVNNRTS